MRSGQCAGAKFVASPAFHAVSGSDFRRLIVYRLAAELANDLYGPVMGWRKEDFWALGLQLLRAVDSIAANIAEASGRWHAADRRRVLFIARGSAYEAEHWLTQAEARQLLPAGTSNRMNDIMRALNGLLKNPTKA